MTMRAPPQSVITSCRLKNSDVFRACRISVSLLRSSLGLGRSRARTSSSSKCSKVMMPLLLLSLSLSKSSSDSTAEEPVEEMEELDSFLRRVPSTASSQSSCRISRSSRLPLG
ncbi:hypothetical protein INR49_030740 [Caranx melampygus]|nr:hypothetical protein INR49_030740 [Caranx melampygus]